MGNTSNFSSNEASDRTDKNFGDSVPPDTQKSDDDWVVINPEVEEKENDMSERRRKKKNTPHQPLRPPFFKKNLRQHGRMKLPEPSSIRNLQSYLDVLDVHQTHVLGNALSELDRNDFHKKVKMKETVPVISREDNNSNNNAPYDLDDLDFLKPIKIQDKVSEDNNIQNDDPSDFDKHLEQLRKNFGKIKEECGEKKSDSSFRSLQSKDGLYDLDDFLEELKKADGEYDEYCRRGKSFSENREYEKSILEYTKGIEGRPSLAYAYTGRANVFLELEKYGEALQDYSKAIDLEPDCTFGYLLRSTVYAHLMEFEKALQDSSKVVELKPEFSCGYSYRGRAYSFLKEYEKALQDYTKAIELYPGTVDLPSFFSSLFLERGNIHIDLKEYEKALQDYLKAVDIYPQTLDSMVLVNLGVIYQNLKEFDKSVENFSKAVELKPQCYGGYLRRGIIYRYYVKNKLNEALEDFSRVIELCPDYGYAFYERGVVYFLLCDYDKAVQDLSKAVDLDPNDVHSIKLRADIFFSLGEKEKSLFEYSKLIEMKQTTEQDSKAISRLYNDRGVNQRLLGDVENALKDHIVAIDLNPEDPDSYFYRGVIYYVLGEYEKAVDDFSRIIELVPQNSWDKRNYPGYLLHDVRISSRVGKLERILLDHSESVKTCSYEKLFNILRERAVYSSIEKCNQFWISIQDAPIRRILRKIYEIDERRYSVVNPTHSFFYDQKLDFHSVIGSETRFVSKFNEHPSQGEVGRKRYSFEDITGNEGICDFFECILVDFEKDTTLKSFVEELSKKYLQELDDHKKRLKSVEFLTPQDPIVVLINKILKEVSEFFVPEEHRGKGSEWIRNNLYKNLKPYLRRIREERKSNDVYLGELKGIFGVCRHRATLWKVVCDELGIRCQLISIAGFHAWNIVWIKDSFFIADLMNLSEKGLILMDEILAYQSNPESQTVMGLTFLEAQRLIVEGDYDPKRKEYKLITKALDSLIMNDVIRRQRELIFKSIMEGKNSGIETKLVDTKEGGFGKVLNYLILEDKEMIEDSKSLISTLVISDDDKPLLFSIDSRISVKRISIFEGEEENPIQVKKIYGVTREGEVERRHAEKEKNFMRIMNHPNIIKYLGSFNYVNKMGSEYLCILMNSFDFNGKEFLVKCLLKNSSISLRHRLVELMYFLIDASQGLQYIHRMEMVHMDFRLENIMVNWDNDQKRYTDLRIIDFGGTKETNYRSSTTVFSVDKNDSPEVTIQKRKGNVRRLTGNVRLLVRNNNGKVDEKNSSKVNEEVDKILCLMLENIPSKYEEMPFLIVKGLLEEIKYILELEITFHPFVKINEFRKSLITKRKEIVESSSKYSQQHPLERIDSKADVFSFGKITESILDRIQLGPFENSIFSACRDVTNDFVRIKDSCLKEKKEDRPTMEEVMVSILIRLSFTVLPPLEKMDQFVVGVKEKENISFDFDELQKRFNDLTCLKEKVEEEEEEGEEEEKEEKEEKEDINFDFDELQKRFNDLTCLKEKVEEEEEEGEEEEKAKKED